jgi:hypothetical protein
MEVLRSSRERQEVHGVVDLPLNKWRAIPKFMRYTSQIRHQLADSEGLIEYALDANVLNRDFWTLSVWEDEESLSRFV